MTAEHREQQAKAAELHAAIDVKLEELGYGG